MGSSQADELERSAARFEADGFWLKCIATLKQVVKVDPSRRYVHLKLAELYLRLGLGDEAAVALAAEKWRLEDDEAPRYLAVVTALVEERPTDAALAVDRAFALACLGRTDDASAEVSRAVPLLRREFPELVANALAVRVTADDLHALRLALLQRTRAERDSRRLDFTLPN